jgi:transposase
LELSSVCVVDETGKIVSEKKVASEPEALVALFQALGLSFTRVGLEAGPLSQWPHAGLTAAGFAAILIETRHAKAALRAMTVKTDRNDARGMAQLVRMGFLPSGPCQDAAGAGYTCLAHQPATVAGQTARC